jgi:predicted ABC-type sugar transport system permease subunit
MDKKYRLITILFGVIITLLVLILVKNSPNYVVAQGDGGARHVFAVVGNQQANREPFYLVDTRQEVIMVYEYGVQGEGLGLVTTRSYKYDKQLEQYGRTYFGPKVDKIRKELEKTRR